MGEEMRKGTPKARIKKTRKETQSSQKRKAMRKKIPLRKEALASVIAVAMAVVIAAAVVVRRPAIATHLEGAIGAAAEEVEHETVMTAALTGVAAMEVAEEVVGGRLLADTRGTWLNAVANGRPGCRHTLPEWAVGVLCMFLCDRVQTKSQAVLPCLLGRWLLIICE